MTGKISPGILFQWLSKSAFMLKLDDQAILSIDSGSG
jgi:hypothetical protein